MGASCWRKQWNVEHAHETRGREDVEENTWKMLSFPALCVLAPDDIPQPNAKRTASGKIVAIASGGGVPCKRGRRGQTKNALYSTAMSGFDWGRWTKWQYPRKDGDARERCASVESSVLRGHYTKLLVLYPDAVNNVPEKKNRAKMRKCARLLVETQQQRRRRANKGSSSF